VIKGQPKESTPAGPVNSILGCLCERSDLGLRYEQEQEIPCATEFTEDIEGA